VIGAAMAVAPSLGGAAGPGRYVIGAKNFSEQFILAEMMGERLREQGWGDGDRVAIYGARFGGFATLSAVTRLPDYWRCGIDLVGPSNLVTFAKAVPPHWRALMKEWVGDPEEDFDFLMSRSPITYVENMKAPLLVLQGANDPRCVKPESDQMVEKLRSIGVDVEYVDDRLRERIEGLVERQLLGERARDPEFSRDQHHARIRTPPQYGLAGIEPREYSMTVSFQQPRHDQIATRSEQSAR